MAIWIAAPDPPSQPDSRQLPCESGIIKENTQVHIPERLNSKRERASAEAQRIFDVLAMRMSHVFPLWKGTRDDFRFRGSGGPVVFILTPRIKFITVDIRKDETGYRDIDQLFPDSPSVKTRHPGGSEVWGRARIGRPADADRIADAITAQLR